VLFHDKLGEEESLVESAVLPDSVDVGLVELGLLLHAAEIKEFIYSTPTIFPLHSLLQLNHSKQAFTTNLLLIGSHFVPQNQSVKRPLLNK
jgi:hypothetical protein